MAEQLVDILDSERRWTAVTNVEGGECFVLEIGEFLLISIELTQKIVSISSQCLPVFPRELSRAKLQ